MTTTDQQPIAVPARPRPPRPRRSVPAAVAVLLAAGAAAGVAACSAPSTPPPAPTTAAAAPASVESVSPQLAAARAAASDTLKSVHGRGNAVGDIRLSGVDAGTAHGHPAATVRITNHSGEAASYAVQVDFQDRSGRTVESTVTALDDLGPGQTATLLTFGDRATTAATTPRVAKAQRH